MHSVSMAVFTCVLVLSPPAYPQCGITLVRVFVLLCRVHMFDMCSFHRTGPPPLGCRCVYVFTLLHLFMITLFHLFMNHM